MSKRPRPPRNPNVFESALRELEETRNNPNSQQQNYQLALQLLKNNSPSEQPSKESRKNNTLQASSSEDVFKKPLPLPQRPGPGASSSSPSAQMTTSEISGYSMETSGTTFSKIFGYARDIIGHPVEMSPADKKSLFNQITNRNLKNTLPGVKFITQGPYSTVITPPLRCSTVLKISNEIVGVLCSKYGEETFNLLKKINKKDSIFFIVPPAYDFCKVSMRITDRDVQIMNKLVVPTHMGYEPLSKLDDQILMGNAGIPIRDLHLYKLSSFINQIRFFVSMVTFLNKNKIYNLNINNSNIFVKPSGKEFRLTDFSLAVYEEINGFIKKIVTDIFIEAVTKHYMHFEKETPFKLQLFLQYTPEINMFINICLFYLYLKIVERNSGKFTIEEIQKEINEFVILYNAQYDSLLNEGVLIKLLFQIDKKISHHLVLEKVNNLLRQLSPTLDKIFSRSNVDDSDVKKIVSIVNIDISKQDTWGLCVSMSELITFCVYKEGNLNSNDLDLFTVLAGLFYHELGVAQRKSLIEFNDDFVASFNRPDFQTLNENYVRFLKKRSIASKKYDVSNYINDLIGAIKI